MTPEDWESLNLFMKSQIARIQYNLKGIGYQTVNAGYAPVYVSTTQSWQANHSTGRKKQNLDQLEDSSGRQRR